MQMMFFAWFFSDDVGLRVACAMLIEPCIRWPHKESDAGSTAGSGSESTKKKKTKRGRATPVIAAGRLSGRRCRNLPKKAGKRAKCASFRQEFPEREYSDDHGKKAGVSTEEAKEDQYQ